MMRRLGLLAAALFTLAGNIDAGGKMPVKVMSFNIRYGTAKDGENHWDKRRAFLAATIKAFAPDLLGTQETLAFQRDYLAGKLSGHHVFGVGREDGKEDGEMTAVYWNKDRFTKLGGGHFWLSETPSKVGSRGWDAALSRMATWLKLADRKGADAKPILFVNTHFDHKGTKAKLESAELLRRQIAKLGAGCSVIVTGDFNSDEGSDPYKALFGAPEGKKAPVVDSYRVVHPQHAKGEGTFSSFKAGASNGKRIDWIGCSRDWTVQSADIDHASKDGRTPSDHFPVNAVLQR